MFKNRSDLEFYAALLIVIFTAALVYTELFGLSNTWTPHGDVTSFYDAPYSWRPQPDITAYELALVMPYFVPGNALDPCNLPIEVRRHMVARHPDKPNCAIGQQDGGEVK